MILQYLAELLELPNHWWPRVRDVRYRAKILQYLSWNAEHIRVPVEELLSANVYEVIEQVPATARTSQPDTDGVRFVLG